MTAEFSNEKLQAWALSLNETARKAGAAIMDVYRTDFTVYDKADDSPVTVADRKAEKIILADLKELTPDMDVLAEESHAAGIVPDVGKKPFWLVDPLDGTKEFIHKSSEFTVNIALIEDRRPVLGIIYVPATDVLYYGIEGVGAFVIKSKGAAPEKITTTEPAADEGLVVVASKRHGDEEALNAFLAGRKVAGHAKAGSSLKFCLIAEGKAHLYPRLGPTCEWDTGAGHAIVHAAGGLVLTAEGEPLTYGNAPHKNPYFVAYATSEMAAIA